MVIPAIVLAAGRSSRMGRPKALLPIGEGDTFLSRIVRTLWRAGVDDVVVVLGHDADVIAASLERLDVRARVVINRDYDRGQLSSLLTGLDVVDRPGVDAALVTLVDVPFVSEMTVKTVLERFHSTRAPIVRPTSRERHGHPVVIDRSLFGRLRRSSDSEGAKPIIRAYASPAGDVVVDDDGAFTDIDTAAAYERATAYFSIEPSRER